MKKIAAVLSLITVVFISSPTYATLAPGTSINDYLPVISGHAGTGQEQGFNYQFQNIDQFEEVEPFTYRLRNELVQHINGGTITVQGLEFNPDPYVTGTTLIANNTNSTQIYTIGVTLPTVFAAPNLIRGSVVVSLLDDAADGVTFSTVAGFPVYSAQIDFGTIATLLNDPYSLSGTSYVNSGLQEFGYQASAIPINSSIGIQLRFALSAGDTASILSRFEVTAIPEPATITLLSFGAMVFLRKRHS